MTCPNIPPCSHGAVLHDIEDRDDESPMCCVEGCECGQAHHRKAITHELKVWPQFWADLVSGRKPFEIRRDDRDFRVGDLLRLREWQPHPKAGKPPYTGREATFQITYALRGAERFGLRDGFVALGIRRALGARTPAEGETG